VARLEDASSLSTLHRRRGSRTRRIRISLLVAVVVGLAWLTLGDDAPPSFALKDAVRAGNRGEVERLLQLRVAVDTRDAGTFSPLQIAIARGDAEISQMLLRSGADAALIGPFGVTALHLVEDPELAKSLLAHGAEPNVTSPHRGTALHSAVEHRAPAILALLLEHGAQPDAVDADGSTALHRAAGLGYVDLARLLICRGADVEASNALGYTPLHWAAGNGHGEMVELLRVHGAKPDRRAEDGMTPGAFAQKRGQHELVESLSAPTGSSATTRPGSCGSIPPPA